MSRPLRRPTCRLLHLVTHRRRTATTTPTPTLTTTVTPVLLGVPKLVSPPNGALFDANQPPKLDWKDVAHADHYQLQLATTIPFTTIPILVKKSEYTLGIGNLSSNTKYYWRVQTCNALNACGSWSISRNFRTKLPAPTLLLPDGTIQNLRPQFSWQMPLVYPTPHAASFTFQVFKKIGFKQLLINKTITGTSMSYTPTADLPRDKTLYWRVQANGLNGPSAWATGTYTTGNPPAIPILVAPANNALVTSYTPSLSWKEPATPVGTDTKSYYGEIATNPAFTTDVIPSLSLIDSPWDVITTLDRNTKYYWHVRACNTVTNYDCSAWSGVRTFRTPLEETPVLLAPLDHPTTAYTTIDRRPEFSWLVVPDATGYTIRISKNSASPSWSVHIL